MSQPTMTNMVVLCSRCWETQYIPVPEQTATQTTEFGGPLPGSELEALTRAGIEAHRSECRKGVKR